MIHFHVVFLASSHTLLIFLTFFVFLLSSHTTIYSVNVFHDVICNLVRIRLTLPCCILFSVLPFVFLILYFCFRCDLVYSFFRFHLWFVSLILYFLFYLIRQTVFFAFLYFFYFVLIWFYFSFLNILAFHYKLTRQMKREGERGKRGRGKVEKWIRLLVWPS